MVDQISATGSEPAFSPPVARGHSVVPLIAVCLLMLGYALLFGWLSLERYWAFQMHALDMGNMGQAAWNTAHGHPFYFTNMRLPYHGLEAWDTTTRLSFHVEALFPLISLVYLIHPHPESLLILQTVAIALGAVPVFLLARDVLARAWLGVLFAGVYLLFPALQSMNLYEFHPVSLACPLLLAAFLFAWRRQYVWFVVCCLAAMGTKEQIGLTVAMFGIYVALINRDWAVGLGVAAAGAIWSLFAAIVVEHHFRNPGTLTYLHSRYGYLGHGVRGILHTVLRTPGVIVNETLTWPKAGYILELLAPVAFLPLLCVPLLLLGAPSWGLNLFSADVHMFSALGDNSAELISVTMIAAILGFRVLLRVLRPWLPEPRAAILCGVYVAAVALWNQHVNGFTPVGSRFQVPSIGAHQRIENKFVSMIPSGVPVSTQDQLDPHLSSRHYLYLFADTGRPPNPPSVPANYILLDASGPTYPLTSDEIHHQAMQYLHRPGWGVQAADDGLILLKKGEPKKSIPAGFYSYMYAGARKPSHPLGALAGSLQIRGFDVDLLDVPNYRIPNLAYTVYLRPARHMSRAMQPVLFERMGGQLVGCSHTALGLAWLPTSRWQPGRTYVVRMQALETTWPDSGQARPGTANLYMDIQPTPARYDAPCTTLWEHHGRLVSLGSRSVSF